MSQFRKPIAIPIPGDFSLTYPTENPTEKGLTLLSRRDTVPFCWYYEPTLDNYYHYHYQYHYRHRHRHRHRYLYRYCYCYCFYY